MHGASEKSFKIGIAAFTVRERKRQAFHSKNEAMGDMIEHLADTFYSNATFLNGRVIKDGTNVILVSFHPTLLEKAMKAKGDFGKEHTQCERSKACDTMYSQILYKVPENDWKWH